MHDSYMYRCVFMLDGDRTEVCDMFPTTFTKGFWLNADFKVTGWLSGSIWIPASQIIFIKKEKIKREGE
ncbi:hypothetical protein KA005_31425 [bacterium]|nr:hypothetical protein [bacterium]